MAWLRRAHFRASVNLSRYIRNHDLTPPQLATLLKLQEIGEASQNELGRLVAMEPANIHKIVDRLSKRGFVRTAKDPKDARKAVISLSGQGRRILKVVEPLRQKATEDTLRVLTPAEQRRLVSLLKRISLGVTD